MRICLTTDQELDNPDGLPGDDWPCDPRPFLPDAEWTLLTLEKETAVSQLIAARDEGFDLWFNLCDGAWDEARPGIEVVQTLERLGVPFTGGDSGFFEPTREAMKRVCRAWGLLTPAGEHLTDMGDVPRALDTLRFPMIVKHPSSYASTGLRPSSVVLTPRQLRAQVKRMLKMAGGALVEEFIAGREATVLVCENAADPRAPHTFTPLVYRFPEGESFKHEKLKWVNYEGLEAHPLDEPELDAVLREASAAFFRGMNGAGWARTDIRIDADGRPWLLEINPNCGIYYPPADAGSADLVLMNDPAGHAGFTRMLVEAAFARHARRRRGWTVRWAPVRGYGVFATRDFEEGEVVVRGESTPHVLVTRERAEQSWAHPETGWFRTQAWPVGGGVYAMPGQDPDAWRPINHGCDPSAWLEGLDVVARRPVAAGDEITLDYATFHDDLLPAFDCTCGAAECRGRVSGADWRLGVVERYGRHVSDHVRRLREGLQPATSR